MIKARLLSDAVLAASAGSIVYISESQLKALGDKAEIVNEAEANDKAEMVNQTKVNDEPEPVTKPKEETKKDKPKTRTTTKKK